MQIVSGQNPVEKGTGLWLFILYTHHGNKDTNNHYILLLWS